MHTDTEIDIEQAEILGSLGRERLERLRSVLHRRTFSRQQVLYVEGAPADRLWVVASGEVRLYKASPRGQVTTLEVLGPGEAFGALSASPEETYASSAEAVTGGGAWWLPRATFLRLLAEEPRLGMEVLQMVSRRLRDAQERLRSFAHDPAPARLADALLRAASEGEARVTRRALAEAAGTTVETAIRVMRRFERAGLVRGAVGRVQILDEPALRSLGQAER